MIFQVVSGVKGQKMVQNDKKFCLSRSTSQEPYMISLSFMVHMYKMIISLGTFSIFQIFDFPEGQKMAQNNKKFSLSHSVSQELYIIWLWFLVHMCKMIICRNFFIFFQNFDFLGFYGSERVKNDLKLPISVCPGLYLMKCRSYHQNFWYTDVI